MEKQQQKEKLMSLNARLKQEFTSRESEIEREENNPETQQNVIDQRTEKIQSQLKLCIKGGDNVFGVLCGGQK